MINTKIITVASGDHARKQNTGISYQSKPINLPAGNSPLKPVMASCYSCQKEMSAPQPEKLHQHILNNKLECLALGLKILLGSIILSTLMIHSPEVALKISNL